MLCSVPLSDVKAKSPRWRFNISLLSNQTFITSLKEYIKEFLEINMPSDVAPQILWEMTKCAIRGFCISFSSTLAKAKTHQFTQLENKIQTLQNLQKQHFTEQQATQLTSLKEEYDLLSHSKVEFILHRTRQKYYFESERPSHLLALRLKECESKAYISAIKSSDDQVTTNPVVINDIFKGFYTNLYKAETDFDEPICKQYLDKLELPQISQIDKESLEAPLSLEELHVSLKSLQKGKSPCSDIYDNQGLCSFQTLRTKFCLTASAYFVFLQLRSALKAYGVPWTSISSHPMRDWIAPSAGRPSVSLIYNKIIDCITKPLSIKTIWNRELSDLNLSVDWESVWFNLSLTSKNLAHRLIHFKVIHRAYITPYKRFKMKLQSNLNCHICNTTSSGTFMHMFWECPVVISLWTHVNLVLSSLLLCIS